MAANNQTLYIYRGEEGEAVPDDATHVLVALSVRVILSGAFRWHQNIVEVDCRNAEIIEEQAFRGCPSLRRVNMRGVTIVERWAFNSCKALTNVKFGDKLESVGCAFISCTSLERITLPLKYDMIDDDDDDDDYKDVFKGCDNLRHVDLLGGEFMNLSPLCIWMTGKMK